MTMGARIDTRITSLAACVNGSITLLGNDPSRVQIRDQWWKFRYHNDDWTDIRYCNGNLNCVTMKSELPDGTNVSIGAHESLIVQRTAQNNTKDRIQFLLEVYFHDSSVLRHIFEVNFTVVCVWTRLQGNLNLSQVFLGQYPLEQLKEIQLLDENGTYFAYMHTRNGASLNVTDDRSLMPPYWNRLKITRGSLILSGITKADNGTTIRSKAFLNDPAIKTSIGSVSVKTIRIFVFNSTGLLMTMGARIDTRITSLAACVNGSITLSGNDPSRFQIRDQWWKFRYHNEDWTDIRYCNGNLHCVTMSLPDGNELPDGTKVSIGAHESLIVQRTAQNNTKDRIQFLLEIYFQNNSVLRHSFEVNFTVVCVWTRLQGNLNLSQVFLGQYPLEQLKEIQLLDENGTYFAYMHTRNGASLNVTDDRSLMPPYWNRLKITRGSLILSGITKADNGTTIRSKAFLNDPAIKTSIGSVSVKTIRIFVFNSTAPKPINEPPGQITLIVIISVVAAAIVIVRKCACCSRSSKVVPRDQGGKRPGGETSGSEQKGVMQ
ncbi:uncharacterized protein [Montipora capricornis]